MWWLNKKSIMKFYMKKIVDQDLFRSFFFFSSKIDSNSYKQSYVDFFMFHSSSWRSSGGTESLHGVNIVPIPPPHGPSCPRLVEGVRVSCPLVRHWDDRLTMRGAAIAQN